MMTMQAVAADRRRLSAATSQRIGQAWARPTIFPQRNRRPAKPNASAGEREDGQEPDLRAGCGWRPGPAGRGGFDDFPGRRRLAFAAAAEAARAAAQAAHGAAAAARE